MKKIPVKLLQTAGTAAVLFFGFYLFTWYGFREERQDVRFGVTFSTVMTRQLGLEPREVFDAIINDLGARKIRLPVYWSDVEPEQEKFAFVDYDYFLKKAEERGAKLILAVGRKLPRWPECFEPEWLRSQKSKVKSQKLLEYIETVVKRYQNSAAVEAWQVENEPFHAYGADCAAGKLETALVEQEIALIRSLDGKTIMLTDSGEQGMWASSLRRADTIGISIYLQVWNEILGVVRFPFGPGFYKWKADLFGAFYPHKRIVVSELEAEPWGPSLLPGYDVEFQKKLMNAEHFRETVSYGRRAGFDTFYLWGAEWWYWLKIKHGDSSIWDEAKKLF